MRARLMLSVAMAATLALSTVANASTVSYSGAEIDTAAHWRTASVAKSYDPDGNNVYGSDGYVIFGDPFDGAVLPFYMSSINVTDTGRGENTDTFPLIDNPTTTPGPSPSQGYLACTQAITGNNVNELNFTVKANVPASFTVSVMTDAAGDPGFVPTGIAVAGLDSSASTATIDRNNLPDMYVFTISGAKAGDYFEIWTNPGTKWNVHALAAVGFDHAVPEPSVLVLLATGVISLLAYAWRKRK